MEEYLVKSSVDLNLINMQSIHSPQELVASSIQGYFNQIDDLITEIQNQPNIKVILLSGPSSSGKTTTANIISEKLKEKHFCSSVVSMDDFFINREDTPILPDGNYDFENITSIDLPYFKKFVNEIIETQHSLLPQFDFISGTRQGYVNFNVSKNEILIIEGIHALNPCILDKHNDQVYRVYVCLNTDFCIDNKVILPAKILRRIRRCIRDFYTRGTTISQTLHMWKNVCDGEEKFIKPFKNNADFLIDSTHNFEPLIYKKYLPPLLDKSSDSKLLETDLQYACEMDISNIPQDCLLWEFISGIKDQY